jgi:uncharacterized protein (DUF433 family)
MGTNVGLDRLIDSPADPDEQCLYIAETGVTVRRVAQWYLRGNSPEEIAGRIQHLSLAQVYTALACYHVNRDAIDENLSHETPMPRTFLDDQER